MAGPRAKYYEYLSGELEQLTKIENEIDRYPLNHSMVELVKLRVSQINGCSFCVRYHSERLRAMGETVERMEMITVWREAPCYSEQERCAFRWAESVTRLSDDATISDQLYADSLEQFGEQGLSQLTMAVVMINAWNRLAVPFQSDHQLVPALLKQMGIPESNSLRSTETCGA